MASLRWANFVIILTISLLFRVTRCYCAFSTVSTKGRIWVLRGTESQEKFSSPGGGAVYNLQSGYSYNRRIATYILPIINAYKHDYLTPPSIFNYFVSVTVQQTVVCFLVFVGHTEWVISCLNIITSRHRQFIIIYFCCSPIEQYISNNYISK